MFKRVIPVLLISGRKLIKTYKFKKRYYVGDPLNAVKVFNEKFVDEICIIDIDATKNGKINFQLIDQISSECFIPISYGGGISNIDEVEKIINSGVEKIIINSNIFDFELIKSISNKIGSQSLIISVDIKKNLFGYYRHSLRNKMIKFEKLIDYLKKIENYCGEFFINSIDKDGTKAGYDLNLYKIIKKKTKKPIIFCGGAASIKNIEELLDNGANAAAVGKIFCFKDNFDSVLISYNKPIKYDWNTSDL